MKPQQPSGKCSILSYFVYKKFGVSDLTEAVTKCNGFVLFVGVVPDQGMMMILKMMMDLPLTDRLHFFFWGWGTTGGRPLDIS